MILVAKGNHSLEKTAVWRIAWTFDPLIPFAWPAHVFSEDVKPEALQWGLVHVELFREILSPLQWLSLSAL